MLQVVWGKGEVRTTTCASGEEKGGRGQLFSAVGKKAREGGIRVLGRALNIHGGGVNNRPFRGEGGRGAGGRGARVLRCER